jgi:hypothetical protein
MEKKVYASFLLVSSHGVKDGRSEEENMVIAREFVRNSPTYQYDGHSLHHVKTITHHTPSCWTFVFTFTSRQGGYGDRKGQFMVQVITPHTASVTVHKGEITKATLDEKWDMIDQKVIS